MRYQIALVTRLGLISDCVTRQSYWPFSHMNEESIGDKNVREQFNALQSGKKRSFNQVTTGCLILPGHKMA